jgi:hypothetical protein
MKSRIVIIVLIIITLLSVSLNVYLLVENKRITEKWEGAEDMLGELKSIQGE